MNIMKNGTSFLACAGIGAILMLSGCMNQMTCQSGRWSLTYDNVGGGVDIVKDSTLLADNVYASFQGPDSLITTQDYTTHKIKIENINDVFGSGKCYQVTYQGDNLPDLIQSFYIYSDKDYILTDFILKGDVEVVSNYMAPVNVEHMPRILPENGNGRALFIPFDNDCWIRYQSCPLTFDSLISYEVTAIFDNDSREGLIVGSVEHNDWKTGISIGKGKIHNVESLAIYGGIADKNTRDSKPHGALKGKIIKSPKVLIGHFADWRQGLECYADVNAVVAPPKAWNKAVPLGWNSWGALQFNLTYEKALKVSDYYKEKLQPNSFVNADNLVYIGLDSGWNKFSEEELCSFVEHCKANGQVAGIYWTPFTDWAKNPEREIEEMPGCKYKDVYLYANGTPQELDGAYAIDPTHPAIEAMMKQTSDLFHRAGFEYVKMDFMTHGAMEADKWYRDDICTGIQAYNCGMGLIDKYFGDMYINLSISPAFPAQYAQSRRIACDAWNKMKDTEYTLNALSYGWWLDRVYQFNDPDHIVLREATVGENRARVTSGVITGLFIAGDDFSVEGANDVKMRAQRFLTNSQINQIANGISFRPVEGDGERSEFQFVRTDADGNMYYAVFNYDKNEELKIEVPMHRLGLDPEKEYHVKELWSGSESFVQGMLDIQVPAWDVQIFLIK